MTVDRSVAERSMFSHEHPHYRWVALSNTTLGMLMATINASIVIISLPAIFQGIKLDPLQQGLAHVEDHLAADRRHGEPVGHHPPPLSLRGGEERGDRAGVVKLQRLPGGRSEVGGQRREFAEGTRRVGALHALGMLLQGEPPVTHRLGKNCHDPFSVMVGCAQVAGFACRAHSTKISVSGQRRHLPGGRRYRFPSDAAASPADSAGPARAQRPAPGGVRLARTAVPSPAAPGPPSPAGGPPAGPAIWFSVGGEPRSLLVC